MTARVSFPKTLTFRSKKLLDSARNAPCLVPGCTDGRPETVVAMHSNHLADGKGRSLKAADYRVAFGCATCHALIDGQAGKLSAEGRDELWEAAHRATVAYWFEKGIVRVA